MSYNRHKWVNYLYITLYTKIETFITYNIIHILPPNFTQQYNFVIITYYNYYYFIKTE